jgi:hypothetical protein
MLEGALDCVRQKLKQHMEVAGIASSPRPGEDHSPSPGQTSAKMHALKEIEKLRAQEQRLQEELREIKVEAFNRSMNVSIQ